MLHVRGSCAVASAKLRLVFLALLLAAAATAIAAAAGCKARLTPAHHAKLPPHLTMSTNWLMLYANEGDTTPVSSTIQIRNDGTLPSAWTLTRYDSLYPPARPWLTAPAGVTSGTIGPGASIPVTVTVDPTGLITGQYGEWISLADPTEGDVSGLEVNLIINAESGPVPDSVDDQKVVVGQPATFLGYAGGKTPLQYQWQRNGVDIPGATASSYTFTAALVDDGALFRVVVTNSLGQAASNAAHLSVFAAVPPPVIQTQPRDQYAIAGFGTGFDAAATSLAPVTWQWQRNGVNIPGATAASLSINSPTLADDGALFRVLVHNAAGTVASQSATLHVAPDIDAPRFYSWMPAVNAIAGTQPTIYSDVSGSGFVSCQWQKNGVDIPGAFDTSYRLPPVTLADDGAIYRLIATNSHGVTTGPDQVLHVTLAPNPLGAVWPPLVTLTPGDTQQFQFSLSAARGEGVEAIDPLTPSAWQWQKNGVAIPGASQHLYTPPPFTAADDGAQFRLQITLAGVAVYTTPATVYVVANQPPRFILAPLDVQTGDGTGACFQPIVTGDGPFTYQWQRDGIDMPGAALPFLSLPHVSLADDGAFFTVTVTNAFGSATSLPAFLQVTPDPPPPTVETLQATLGVDDTGPAMFSDHMGLLPTGWTQPSSTASWCEAPWYQNPFDAHGYAHRPADWAGTPLGSVPAPANNLLTWIGSGFLFVSNGYPDSYILSWPETFRWIAAPPDPWYRLGGSAVWTGSELIAWGGTQFYFPNGAEDTGYRYTPPTDTWSGPLTRTAAPTARAYHCAVWTGSRMIIWGGTDGVTPQNTGALYDPATETWTPMTTAGAPAARFGAAAVWTGSRMIVWGGQDNAGCFNDGGSYDPATDTWAAGPALLNAPAPRAGAAAVWTGTMMVVAGGTDAAGQAWSDNVVYDPAADRWLGGLPGNPAIGFLTVPRLFITPAGLVLFSTNGSYLYRPPLALGVGDYTTSVPVLDSGSPALVDVTLHVVDAAPHVTAMTPAPGATVSAPATVVITCDRWLDRATVNATTVTLVGSGGDGTFGDGNEVIIAPAETFSYIYSDITIDLTSVTLPPDTYQVRVSGAVRSYWGSRLDGEFTGSFPSGDGTPGGDFVATFVVN